MMYFNKSLIEMTFAMRKKTASFTVNFVHLFFFNWKFEFQINTYSNMQNWLKNVASSFFSFIYSVWIAINTNYFQKVKLKTLSVCHHLIEESNVPFDATVCSLFCPSFFFDSLRLIFKRKKKHEKQSYLFIVFGIIWCDSLRCYSRMAEIKKWNAMISQIENWILKKWISNKCKFPLKMLNVANGVSCFLFYGIFFDAHY